MEIAGGKVVDISPDGYCTIRAVLPNIDRAILRQYEKVQIGFADGRTITPEQRRKAYALMGEISAYSNQLPGHIKKLMKFEFITYHMNALVEKMFSMSDCDVTTAREFISFLIDFMLEYDIPSKRPLIELCDDIEKYVYICLMHRKCAVCGKSHADLHHVIAIGAGINRDTVYQIGMPVLPLCRDHHMESHNIGQKSFMEKYHLQPIGLTVEIGKKYKLTKKNLQRG